MPWTLISQDEIEALPEDNDAEAFVRFERICRDKMAGILQRFGHDDDPGDVYFEYMVQINAAAAAYGLNELYLSLPEASSSYEAYRAFTLRL